ncbi:MAG: hypothetical protein Hens2KO_27850 [Henriciella sp.]
MSSELQSVILIVLIAFAGMAVVVLVWLLIKEQFGRTKTPEATPNPSPIPVPSNRPAHGLVLSGLNSRGESVTIQLSVDALADGPVSIGRDKADKILNDPLVSRPHCSVAFNNDRFEIRDLGSRNGTFVNGKSIGENNSTALKLGDTVELSRQVKLNVSEL